MDTIDFIGIVSCILVAVYTAVSFPITVKISNGERYPKHLRLVHFGLGVLMYSCLAIYTILKSNYILAFAQVMGVMKYSVVLIQLAINKKIKRKIN